MSVGVFLHDGESVSVEREVVVYAFGSRDAVARVLAETLRHVEDAQTSGPSVFGTAGYDFGGFVVGRPVRPWLVAELRGQLASLGIRNTGDIAPPTTRVRVEDLHPTERNFSREVREGPVGEFVTGTVEGVGGVLRGAGDLARGAGDIARDVGGAAANVGGASNLLGGVLGYVALGLGIWFGGRYLRLW